MSTIAYLKNIGAGSAGNPPVRISLKSGLSVFVVFTSIDGTLRALGRARDMAKALCADITVIAMQVVPFPLPLDEPPVGFESAVSRFRERAHLSAESLQIMVCLCRDPFEALKVALIPDCPVVIDIGRQWWPNRDGRLARRLLRAGYDVVSVNQR